MLNLINHESDIDKKKCKSAKNPYEAKYKFLISKREDVGTKNFNDSKAFIEYAKNMNNIYKNIERYNPNKKQSINCFWWYDCWYA